MFTCAYQQQSQKWKLSQQNRRDIQCVIGFCFCSSVTRRTWQSNGDDSKCSKKKLSERVAFAASNTKPLPPVEIIPSIQSLLLRVPVAPLRSIKTPNGRDIASVGFQSTWSTLHMTRWFARVRRLQQSLFFRGTLFFCIFNYNNNAVKHACDPQSHSVLCNFFFLSSAVVPPFTSASSSFPPHIAHNAQRFWLLSLMFKCFRVSSAVVLCFFFFHSDDYTSLIITNCLTKKKNFSPRVERKSALAAASREQFWRAKLRCSFFLEGNSCDVEKISCNSNCQLDRKKSFSFVHLHSPPDTQQCGSIRMIIMMKSTLRSCVFFCASSSDLGCCHIEQPPLLSDGGWGTTKK